MGGYRRGLISFNIGHISLRKKPCIWITYKNQAYMVGQFKDDKSAKDFLKVLDFVMSGNNEDSAYAVFESPDGNERGDGGFGPTGK